MPLYERPLLTVIPLPQVGSTVSTRAIEALAEARGFEYHQTLTGFKWMGRKAAELENEGKTVLLLFEEAIGYALGDGVVYCPKDKDGVSAAAVMGEITVHTRQQDTSLSQLLDDIYKEIGYFACHVRPAFMCYRAIVNCTPF